MTDEPPGRPRRAGDQPLPRPRRGRADGERVARLRRDRQPLEGRRGPGDPEPQPDARPPRGGGASMSDGSGLLLLALGRGAGGGRGARRRRSSPRASAPPASPAGSRAAARPTSACWAATPRGLLGAAPDPNAAAAAPVRVCRERCDAGAIRGWSSTPATRTRRPASRATATRSRCATPPRAALGLEPARVAVAETGTIGVPLDIEAVLGGHRARRRRALGVRRARASPRRSSPPTGARSAARFAPAA